MPPKLTESKSVIDLPMGTVVWVPFPKPLYNSNMQQQNRMAIVPDKRNGTYILLFLLVTTENGVEKEQEINRLVFQNKEELQKFSIAAVTLFGKHAKD